MDSILQDRRECYLCRRFYNLHTVRGLEEHYIMYGRGRRELSELYGLKVWLCRRHHNAPPLGVHFNPDTRRALEEEARTALDARYGAGAFDRIFKDREEE